LHDILSFLPHALVALVVGYLLGSIPFGLILTRLAGTADIRAIGSGNIGATNVLRTGRRGLAGATLVGDMLKGTAAVLTVNGLAGADAALVSGLGAILGHVFPVWLRFSGGKGVATYLGVLVAVAPLVALLFAAVWGLVAALTRYSSLSALVASAFTPALLWGLADGKAALLFVFVTVVIFLTHRANITRLIAGTEPKIGQSQPSAP
jgi:glycerol-3-phosphate acyltransferase PlsY